MNLQSAAKYIFKIIAIPDQIIAYNSRMKPQSSSQLAKTDRFQSLSDWMGQPTERVISRDIATLLYEERHTINDETNSRVGVWRADSSWARPRDDETHQNITFPSYLNNYARILYMHYKRLKYMSELWFKVY
jgi:hypothetical protein